MAAKSGFADPDALVARICKETGGEVSLCGFVTRIGSPAPLSDALRDVTLAHVNMVHRMVSSDIKEYVAAGMPDRDVALLQRALDHAEGLRENLAANVRYPNVHVVAELMMLTREVADTAFSLNNLRGIADAADDQLPGLFASAGVP
jgi:hypothetical protein